MVIRLGAVAAALVLLLSGCVLYEKQEGFTNTIVTFPWVAPLPPAKYERDVPMIVKRMSPRAVHRFCSRTIKVKGIIKGCARISRGKTCVIVIPNDEPVGGRIWRHERGHCAGWRHPY